MANILHVTAHMGGGVGKILSAICMNDYKNIHKILCMEDTKNKHFYNIAISNDIDIRLINNEVKDELLKWADIVQVEWWHNPAVTKFLVQDIKMYRTRLMIWSHISGCNYPRLPYLLIEKSDKLAFTSPYSYDNPSFTENQVEKIKHTCPVIPSVGNNFEPYICRQEHKGFSVGYVGFLGYNKLNCNYVKFCEGLIEIPSITFPITGELEYADELISDIENSVIKDLFVIKGYSENVNEEFSKMDILGYPLFTQHTGTTENVLLEAMSMGVVPVVLSQGCEKYLVQNGKTGFVVKNESEYVRAIHFLYDHPQELIRMSELAQKHVLENYGLDKTIDMLDIQYQELMREAKKKHELDKVFGTSPFDWFCSCYAGDLEDIKGLAMSNTKGSLRQYLQVFPEDNNLRNCLERNEVKNV